MPRVQNQAETGEDVGGTGRENADHQSHSPGDDWASVQDPAERRKIQNKLAQRRYRQKAKEETEEREREQMNREHAGTAYKAPEPGDLDEYPGQVLSGLPWGGPSMGHIVRAGRMHHEASQRSSSEASSLRAPESRFGGSSRLRLYLTDHFARGTPAWRGFPNQNQNHLDTASPGIEHGRNPNTQAAAAQRRG